MKKIFNSVVALALVFSIASCSDDDNNTIPVTTNTVTATVSALNTITAQEDNFDVTVTIDQAYSTDATVRITAEAQDDRIARATAVIPAGQTSGIATLQLPLNDGTFAGANVFFNGNVKIVADGFVLADQEAGQEYRIDSNTYELALYDAVPTRDDENFGIVFDWSNAPANDLDLYVLETSTFNVIDLVFTGSRFEFSQVLADSSVPDGTYGLAFEVWSAVDTEIDATIIYRNTNGETVTWSESWTGVASGDFYFPDTTVERTVTKTITKTTTTSTDASIPDTV